LLNQVNEKLVIRGGAGLYISNPNNDIFQTAAHTPVLPSSTHWTAGRTPIPNILSNPYPTGINRRPGSRDGTLTFAGKNNSWFDSNAVVPKAWTYSFGFQYQVNKFSTLEATYVGTYSYDQTMQKDYKSRRSISLNSAICLQAGVPTIANQSVPNPFRGIPAFLGTSYYTSTTISRANLARPFPQFSGNMTQFGGRNDSYIRYDSAQFNYNVRMRGGPHPAGQLHAVQADEEWALMIRYNKRQAEGSLLPGSSATSSSLRAFWTLPSAKARSSAQAATGSSRSSFPAGPGTARSPIR